MSMKLSGHVHRFQAVMLAVLILFVTSFCPAAPLPGQVEAHAASSYTSVEIKSTGTVVDSLDGVSAVYTTASVTSGKYSCAGYVNSYYKSVAGISVSNLIKGATPVSSNSAFCFKPVKSGFQKGDIVWHSSSNSYGHWAIVKSVSGNKLTLIEQNWKWKSGGKLYGAKNRVVTYPNNSMKVYRLSIKDAPSISKMENNVAGRIYLKWSGSKATDTFQVQYSESKDFGSATKVSASGTVLRINGLSKGHTYYVRVRAMKKLKNGKTVYSSWSGAKAMKLSL